MAALLPIDDLPGEALAAAAHFHAHVLPRIHAQTDQVITLLLPAADHTHRAWRTAALGSLARTLAPRRINATAGGDAPAVVAACAFLEAAPGVTGQVLVLDGHGAGEVLG